VSVRNCDCRNDCAVWSSAAPATSREINDLYAELFKIWRVQISLAGHFQIWHRLYVPVPVGLGNLGIEGNRVNSCDEGLLQAHILEITAGGSVAEEHAAGINESKSGTNKVGEVDRALMNVLVKCACCLPRMPYQFFVPRVTPVRL
jgi:hypothetical protein